MNLLRLYIGATLIVLLSLSGCGSSDVSLLNDVKRFEPEWVDLSEQVTNMDQALRKSEYVYEAFFKWASPQLSNPERNQRTGLYSARSQYEHIMEERSDIASEFAAQKQAFVEAVEEFNLWQNQLMQGKVEEVTAGNDFEAFQMKHKKLQTEISSLMARLSSNAEDSNALVRRVCTAFNSIRCDEYVVDIRQW